MSGADNAPLRLWAYTGGQNQQWLPVKEAAGRCDFTARHSGKCLTAEPANGTQLTQRTRDGSAAQSLSATAAYPGAERGGEERRTRGTC